MKYPKIEDLYKITLEINDFKECSVQLFAAVP